MLEEIKEWRTVDQTEKYSRKITGKKGIGKLSVFGICSEIYVESCKNKKNKYIQYEL